jgi:NADH-quinone oxidoreductase subunit M
MISALGVILCGAYSLWLYNRVIFGNLKVEYTTQFIDMNSREFLVLFPLFISIFIMGIYPSFFTFFINIGCSSLSFFSLN